MEIKSNIYNTFDKIDIFICMETTKIKISVTIDSDITKQLKEEKINKSRLINWLLKTHYDSIKVGGGK